MNRTFQVALVVKNLPANAEHIETQVDPWVGKIPWRRKWQLIPAWLPGEFHVEKSLESYSPRGHKELDMTEHLSTFDKYFFHEGIVYMTIE